jgi:predicted ferric reductase
MGQIALILLLLHPLFLIPKYSGSLSYAASFLLPGQDWSINFGILALWTMLFLIILTLYFKPKYDLWKYTHKFLGLALFLAAFHVWLIPSDTSNYLPLKLYILTVIALGLITFLYRSIFGSIFIKKSPYVVERVIKLNDKINEIRMKPLAEPLTYTPGQFVFLEFQYGKGVTNESHPFSLTSNPDEDYLSVSIKNLGDFTSEVGEITPQTKVKVEGPFGRFSYKNANYKDQIWIAGGIGITPFISMAKSLEKETDFHIDLIYCVNNESEAVYLDYLTALAERKSGIFRLTAFYSNQRGYINANDIINLTLGIENKDIFLCSPPGMISALRKQLLEAGADVKLIHSEEFSL